VNKRVRKGENLSETGYSTLTHKGEKQGINPPNPATESSIQQEPTVKRVSLRRGDASLPRVYPLL